VFARVFAMFAVACCCYPVPSDIGRYYLFCSTFAIKTQ